MELVRLKQDLEVLQCVITTNLYYRETTNIQSSSVMVAVAEFPPAVN